MRNPPSAAERRRGPLAGITVQDAALRRDLLKLRLVLTLIAAPRGSKLATVRACVAECRATNRFKVCVRSVYGWRECYLRLGFAGIARKRRSDRGNPRNFGTDVLARLVDAASRVRRQGDVQREYRAFRSLMAYETFRGWIRRLRAKLRVIQIPQRGDRSGLIF